MKRLIVVLVLIICVAAVAFASLRSKHKAATNTEKKEIKKDIKKKKECRHTCLFS